MSMLVWNGQAYAQTNDKLALQENATCRIVNGNCIARILPDTSIDAVKQQLNNINVTIYKSETEREVVTSGIAKTGMIVTDGTTSYTISVIGDVNKDGRLNQIDICQMIGVIIGTQSYENNTASKCAFDVNDDNAIDQRDLSKMIRYVVFGRLDVAEENNTEPTPDPVIDQSAPVIEEVQYSTTNWTNQSVTVTGGAQDTESGIVAYQVGLEATPNANNWKTITKTMNRIPLTMTVSENGIYYWFVKDAIGNVATKKIEVKHIDTQAPSLEVKAADITTQYVSMNVRMADTQSGVQVSKYALGNQNATYFTTQGNTFTGENVVLSVDGTYTFYVKDKAGNTTIQTIDIAKKVNPQAFSISKIEGAQTNLAFIKGETTSFTIVPGRNGKIDTNKIKVTGAADFKTQVTSNGNVIVTLTAGSKTGEMYVSVGEKFITDNNGNYSKETSIGPFYVDNTGPSITSFATTSVKKSSIRVAVKAADTGKSGLASKETYTYYMSKNSSFSNATEKVSTATEYTFTGLEAGTTYYFKVVAKDNNGNTTTSKTIKATTTGTSADLNAISFSNDIVWDNGVASITLYKEDSNVNMEYAVIDDDGDYVIKWKETSKNRVTLYDLSEGMVVKARLVDAYGNTGKYVTLDIVDAISPEAGTVRMTTVDDGLSYRVYDGNTVNASVLVELYNGTDEESGHYRTRYTITGPENVYNTTGDALLTENGTYKIVVTTEDKAGNTSKRTYRITINKKNTTTSNRLTIDCTNPSGFKYIDAGESYTFYLEMNRPVYLVDEEKLEIIKDGVRCTADITGYGTQWKIKVKTTSGKGTVDVRILPGMFMDYDGNLSTQEIDFPRIWVESGNTSSNNSSTTDERLVIDWTNPSGFKYIQTGESYTYNLVMNKPVYLVNKYYALVQTSLPYTLEVTGYGTNWKVTVTPTKGTGTMNVNILPGMFMDYDGNLSTQEIIFATIYVQ